MNKKRKLALLDLLNSLASSSFTEFDQASMNCLLESLLGLA